MNLTINNSSTSTSSATACDTYSWNGTTYTSSGAYTYVTTNSNGCDSTATLNLTINPSTTPSTDVTECDTYTWNGTTYTTSGTYTYSTTNAAGCDSIATLDLTINYTSNSRLMLMFLMLQVLLVFMSTGKINKLSPEQIKEINSYFKKFPEIKEPKKEDICYATTNRQAAVKKIAKLCDMFFVIGSRNSSNSVRLVEVANNSGCKEAILIHSESNIPMEKITKCQTIGISSGASSVQRKIMTTVEEKNVFNIAVEGNFDDCQNIVKSMFSDLEFSRSINMSGVNSINWARIIAQTVYYFYTYFKLNKKSISFSVPTGNFGDVFAGYLAKKMGLPIDKLIVATNENDILHRAISNGDYEYCYWWSLRGLTSSNRMDYCY